MKILSPTHNNVSEILPAGQCRDADIIFCLAIPAHLYVGKRRHFIVMQKYHTIEYIHTDTQQPTRAVTTLLPLAFPSSLSMGTAAAPSNHGAAAPPCHAQAASCQDLVAVIVSIAGEGEKRGIKK
jgi:hypothetical protein